MAVLEEHGAVARVAADACRRIADLAEEGDRQAALDAGALVAVQAASKAHRLVEAVTDAATDALRGRGMPWVVVDLSALKGLHNRHSR